MIEIRKIIKGDWPGEQEVVGVKVLLDGKEIGEGGFGGEPEDNCESRTYSWVIPLLMALALQSNGDVKQTKVTHKEEYGW